MSNQKLKRPELSRKQIKGGGKKMQNTFLLRSNLKDLLHSHSLCRELLAYAAVFPHPASPKPDLPQGDDNDSTKALFFLPLF